MKHKKRNIGVLGYLSIIAILVGIVSCDNVSEQKRYRVIKVYDGDTVGFANRAHVRLLGIDCPEMVDNAKLNADARSMGQSKDFIKEQGRQAFEFTHKLLMHEKVQVEFDKEKKDKYGRWLAYLWIELGNPGSSLKVDVPAYFVKVLRKDPHGKNKEYIFVNATIIKAGFAYPFATSDSLRYGDMLRQLYDQARAEKRGLWQAN